tara:strand:+ start:401 stop:592 length:192 start_codon:yes stop_codon:yes gene_type:complete
MPKDKIDVNLKIEREQLQWIDSIADEYKLKDQSKVIRVLIDFAIKDADTDLVFSKENSRCMYC